MPWIQKLALFNIRYCSLDWEGGCQQQAAPPAHRCQPPGAQILPPDPASQLKTSVSLSCLSQKPSGGMLWMQLLHDTTFTKGATSHSNWLKQLCSHSSRQYLLHPHCTAANSQDLKPMQKEQQKGNHVYSPPNS